MCMKVFWKLESAAQNVRHYAHCCCHSPEILRGKFSKACLITSHWDPKEEKLFLKSHRDPSCCWEVHKVVSVHEQLLTAQAFQGLQLPPGKKNAPVLNVVQAQKEQGYNQSVMSAMGMGWSSSPQLIDIPRLGSLVATTYEPQLRARNFNVHQELSHF